VKEQYNLFKKLDLAIQRMARPVSKINYFLPHFEILAYVQKNVTYRFER